MRGGPEVAALAPRDQDLSASRRSSDARGGPRAHDYDGFYVLDDELHRALCDLSGHGSPWSLSQRAKGHLNRVRRLGSPARLPDGDSSSTARSSPPSPRHDPDGAERALRHHLRMVLSTLPAIREQRTDYFESDEESP